MTESVEIALQKRLAEFVVPQTNRSLGAGGTELRVDMGEAAARVTITCGFPLDRSRDRLLVEVSEWLKPLELDLPVEIDLSGQVQSHAVQPGVKALPNIRNIIAIASGKGGVGKSTVTANVALALAQEGAQVGILDADIYGPSQPRILSLTGQRPETVGDNTMRPLLAYGVSVMSIGFLVEERQALAWRGPMVTSALNQMLAQTDWGELDYLFVDMPPGTGDIQLTLAQSVPVSGAVIVTTPQDIALSDARKGVELFRKVSLPVLGIVENMAVHVCGKCGHEESIFGSEGGARLANEYDVPLLGSLPLQRDVREHSDAGTPVVVADAEGAAAKAFRETALRIGGELAVTGRGYSHLFPDVAVEGTS